jgi:DNA processing protein
MVAIVGTRHPTAEAVRFAETLAQGITGQGFAVISGGAAGIDTAAHRGALAAGGPTLVVAPAGWNTPYPEGNRELFQDIVARGGGYLSLVAPDQRPLSGHFFARNAVLVALACATVVVQAPVRSGARNAAHIARKLERLLYVVPSAPWVESGAGCVVELRLGARPLGSIGDLLLGLAAIGVHGKRDPLQLELPLPLSKVGVSAIGEAQDNASPLDGFHFDPKQRTDLAPVMQAISAGSRSLDSVCQSLGLSTPNIQSALLRLCLAGCIRISSAGRIEIVSIDK